jgi:predicted nucleotidyltransferase
MITYHTEEVFGTRSRVAVLRVLAGVSVPLSIRQVARFARISHVSARDALDALADLGVVQWSIAGRSRVHWLERRSMITRQIVLPVFAAEADSGDALVAELKSFIPDGIISAVLFGSYARGDMGPHSDIDVVVVAADQAAVDAALESIDGAAGEMRAAFGASVSALGYTLAKVKELEPGTFIDGVLKDGIVLRGAAPYEWGDLVEDTSDVTRAGGRG